MKHIPPRVAIYPKDIANITGRSDRTARKILQTIKKASGKNKQQFVTIKEFCLFTGINNELIKDFFL
jgi:hypothetical protein